MKPKELKKRLDEYIEEKYSTKVEMCYYNSMRGCYNDQSESRGLECNLCEYYLPMSEGFKMRLTSHLK